MRAVNVDELLAAMKLQLESLERLGGFVAMTQGYELAMRDVANMPAVEAIPILRCQDCKYWERVYNDAGCEMINYSHCGLKRQKNFVCVEGERMSKEEKG